MARNIDWHDDMQWASGAFHRASNSKWFDAQKNKVDKIHMEVRSPHNSGNNFRLGDIYITVNTETQEMTIGIKEEDHALE